MTTNIAQERQSISNRLLETDTIDLLEIWNVIWRRKWSIISLTVILMMISALVVLSMTPIYRATATLLIEKKSAQVVSIEQVYGLDGSGSEYLLTQFELLKSRELAERVVRELNLVEHPEFDPRQAPEPIVDVKKLFNNFNIQNYLPMTLPGDLAARDEALTDRQIFEAVVEKLMENTTVSPVGKTQLVKIEYEAADRLIATDIANAIVNGYIESQLEAKLNMTQTATNWMNERIGSLKSKLQDSERRLQAFRDRENLVDVEGVTTVAAGELSQTNSRLIDARRAKAEAESQYKQIESLGSANWRRLATVPAILGDPLVQQFKADEARARSKVEELARRYGPKHPKMQSAQTELSAAVTNLQSQVQQVAAAIQREYQLATANERSLKSSFEANKQEIQDITRKEFMLRELQREVDTNRQLYDTFFTRLKETSATSDLESANARVVDKAVVPSDPVKPKKSLIVALTGVLAMMLGVGLTLLINSLNNTFKGTEEVENKLNLPVLGVLPLLKGMERKSMFRLFNSNKNKAFAESIRTIRTGVVLSGLDNPHKVLVVTSSVPGEGKSSISVNLAAALGQMERVLLIDADMRRPTIAKSFEYPVGTPGLANIVSGNATIEDALQSEEGIDVIGAGTVPPNPLELLSSHKFAELLQELETRYDRIVIDSAPTQAVSDAMVLGQHANAVIYVIKSDSTQTDLAKKGVGQLLQNQVPVTGVVLNQVDIKKAQKYGYSYSGYYDYYGYSSGKAS